MRRPCFEFLCFFYVLNSMLYCMSFIYYIADFYFGSAFLFLSAFILHVAVFFM